MAIIETQSPCLGSLLPKNIWITNARRGKNKMYSE